MVQCVRQFVHVLFEMREMILAAGTASCRGLPL